MREPPLLSLTNFGRLLLTLGGASFGVLASVHSFGNSATVVATCGGLAVVCILSANLHLLESLKGFGFEAKTRELNRRIDEAEEITRRLRRLAELAAATVIDHQAKIGRSVPPTVQASYWTKNEVKALLNDVGCSDVDVAYIVAPWASWMIQDVAYGIEHLHRGLVEGQLGRVQRDPSRKLEAEAASTFLEENLRGAYNRPIDAYPAHWERIAECLPLVSEDQRARLIVMARALGPVIDAIRVRHEIPDVEVWAHRLEDLRHIRMAHREIPDWC